MGAGCSRSSPDKPKSAADAPAPQPSGPQPGHVYLSYHPADTGDQRTEGGDGAAGRVRDWLASRGYVVLLSQPDPDAAPPGQSGPRGPAGVQAGLQQSWQARMLQSVESCQAFVALCSEHYGTRSETTRELNAVDSLSASATTLLPLWHSGSWPPEAPLLQQVLGHLQRVPRGTRPLCRTILEGVMGELVDRLQQAGCRPPAAGGAAGTGGAAAGGGGDGAGGGGGAVAVPRSLDALFQAGPEDPTEDAYVVVKCYTGQLQELSDRMALTVRPTIFDLGGETFSGDLPVLPSPTAAFSYGSPAPGAAAPDPTIPASGGSLVIHRPNVTLRNGALKLRQDQELRLTANGVALDTLSVMIEPRQGPQGMALGAAGGWRAATGAAYESGRSMVVVVGAVGVRMTRCQLTNHGPHLALWLAHGATAALRDCHVEAPSGGGVWVRDAGSSLAAQSCHLHRCSGPCLKLEAGAAAQLESCSVVDSTDHNALLVGSGSSVRADRCVVSGAQVGLNLFAGATAELVGCEVVSNQLAGAEVSEQGSRLTAVDTKFSTNGQSGVMVALGASASLTSCTSSGNKAHGVLVRDSGSECNLRQVTLSYNAQAGVLVSSGGRSELLTCEATGNKLCGLIVWGAGAAARCSDCKLVQNVQAGLAVKDGGVAELARCWVKGNKLPSEVAGAGSRLVTQQGCVLDPKPTVVNGGVHQVEEGKDKKKK